MSERLPLVSYGEVVEGGLSGQVWLITRVCTQVAGRCLGRIFLWGLVQLCLVFRICLMLLREEIEHKQTPSLLSAQIIP